MNAIAGIRPQAYQRVSFEAWRVAEGRSSPIEMRHGVETIAEAVRAAQPACLHKETLLIKATDAETGASKVHVFMIRQKAPKWVHPAGELMPRRVQDLFADPVCVIDAAVLG